MRVVHLARVGGWRLLRASVAWPGKLGSWRRTERSKLPAPEVGELHLVVRVAAVRGRASRSLADGDVALSEQGLAAIQALMGEIRKSEKPSPPERVAGKRGQVTFIVDSLFLADAANYLIHRQPAHSLVERFHYVTGAKVADGTYTLNHIVQVEFAEQSAVYLRVNDLSNFAALESLDYWGTPLLAHFHSHPGTGAGATHPSGIDRRFQERLERGGHIAVGGIFSQDGFLGFFAGDSRRFQIRVFGNQVKEIERNVFKVSLADGNLPIHSTTGGRSGKRG